MPRPSQMQLAEADIASFFRAHSDAIFDLADIGHVLEENRDVWRLAKSTTVNNFLDFLLEKTDLRVERFAFPSRPITRYTWDEVPVHALVQSLKPEGYFTHYTAMHLHGLTNQVPKTIYLNFEQRATGGGGQLSQAGIDRAFRGKCRVSNNVATFGDRTVCLLNGQNTGQLGVTELDITDGSRVRVTGVERTLIDAVVRPVYSGGVFEVARAFQAACGQVSVNKLTATLRKLNYTYPYHQAIGFYLEHAGGYRESQLDLLRQFDVQYDFYLTHDVKDRDYNRKWRLFIPKGF